MLTRIFLFTFLIGSFSSLMCQHNNEDVLIDRQSLSTASIQMVEADAESGNISIEGVSSSDARIEVYAWSRGTEATTRERFQEFYDVKIKTNNGTLTVSAERKGSRMRDPKVSLSFRIYVPVSASSDLRTNGGNIRCLRLSGGRQKVMTSGGNLAFDDIKGNVSGKTSGGNISIVNCSDNIELQTSGGNINSRQSNGQITLFTSGGNISLDGLSGTVKAQTSGGNIAAEQMAGTFTTSTSGGNVSLTDLSCSLDASTSGGNMDVSFLKMGQYVKLSNRGSGNTRLQMPEGTGANIDATGNSVKFDHAKNFTGDMSERQFKGTINGGGIPVTIDGGDSKVVISVK